MSFVKNVIDNSSLSLEKYKTEYKNSIENPDNFWKEKAKTLDWIKDFSEIKNSSFKDNVEIKWFSDGTLNASYNCLDRHLKERENKVAIIWESDDPSLSKKITYKELHQMVCKFSNGLKSIGLKKGDRVTIYMPMIP